ncbi:acetyltransferase, GNAT family [Bacillus cereus NC7401]|nr:acetyltransferase, GNAT family [Bacillus cereus NC7401]
MFRRMKIGNQLLKEAEKLANERNLNRLEAWTRDNPWVHGLYENNGFVKVDSYLHVYSDHTDEIKGVMKSNIDQLYPIQTFAHYTGENKEDIRKQFKRVHDCFCFEKYFN